ncbi:hypothetical protein D3C84_462560 [compost metagenome]
MLLENELLQALAAAFVERVEAIGQQPAGGFAHQTALYGDRLLAGERQDQFEVFGGGMSGAEFDQ